MRGSVFITVKFTVIIMIIMVIITAINTVISFRDLSRWSCDHRCVVPLSYETDWSLLPKYKLSGLLQAVVDAQEEFKFRARSI